MARLNKALQQFRIRMHPMPLRKMCFEVIRIQRALITGNLKPLERLKNIQNVLWAFPRRVHVINSQKKSAAPAFHKQPRQQKRIRIALVQISAGRWRNAAYWRLECRKDHLERET